MKAFAALIDRLAFTPGRNDKLRLLVAYLRDTPDPDRGYALAALTDGLPLRLPLRRILADLVERHVDPVLYRLSRDYVGDTAETVALLWPERESARPPEPPRLSEIVEMLLAASGAERPAIVGRMLDELDASGRWAFLKLIGGGFRIGVSARLARTALADMSGQPIEAIEEIWHGLAPPYRELFAWLEGNAPRPRITGAPVFRPMMLAHPIEEATLEGLDIGAHLVEWKWDGIRVQVARRGGVTRLYSRTGDDISAAFPDVLEGWSEDVVLDGELLVMREGEVAAFSELQQRLNRKIVRRADLASRPAHVRLYDALILEGEDLRGSALDERRRRLEAWHRASPPPRTDLSPVIAVGNLDEIDALWRQARDIGIEGLMLKTRASPYLAGRPRGHWWKLKRAPLTADCVLMYAQRGSGRRSSLYSDFTFGAWRVDASGARELVPVGKAYSGFTDEELGRLDRFIRAATRERFGPVRAVEPRLVLEIAFDDIQRSSRHKSGVAMRFPRIHRIRWDKPAEEADDLERLTALITGS
ncbi:MAG: cisplatin damage response ATP-dependent DNA ligase [Hyphomicrobiaceae bacterium]